MKLLIISIFSTLIVFSTADISREPKTTCDFVQNILCGVFNYLPFGRQGFDCVKDHFSRIECNFDYDCDNFIVNFSVDKFFTRNGNMGIFMEQIMKSCNASIGDMAKEFVKAENRENLNCFKQQVLQMNPNSHLISDFNEKTLTEDQKDKCKEFIEKFVAVEYAKEDEEYNGRFGNQTCVSVASPTFKVLAFKAAIIANSDVPNETINHENEEFGKQLPSFINETLNCMIDKIKAIQLE